MAALNGPFSQVLWTSGRRSSLAAIGMMMTGSASENPLPSVAHAALTRLSSIMNNNPRDGENSQHISEEDFEMLVAHAEGRLPEADAQKLRKRLSQEPQLLHALSGFFESVRETGYGEQFAEVAEPSGARVLGGFSGFVRTIIEGFSGGRSTQWRIATALAALIVIGIAYVALQPPPEKPGPTKLLAALNFDDVKTIFNKANANTGTKKGIPSTAKSIFSPASGTFAGEQKVKISTAGGADWSHVYEEVAPSVVYLRNEYGFATGFFIQSGGWVLTNYHVAVFGKIDENGRNYLDAIIGNIDPATNFMRPSQQKFRVYLYKWDEGADLALFRVDPNTVDANALATMKPIPMRPTDHKLGVEEVGLIGNAGEGALWSIKNGKVSQVTRFGDISFVYHEIETGLTAQRGPTARPVSEEERHEISRALMGVFADTLVIECTAAAAHGDSGGPLVDADGNLVGVCTRYMALPGDNAARFFYIHYSVVDQFLKSVPDAPMILDPFDLNQILRDGDVVAWQVGSIASNGVNSYAVIGMDASRTPCFLAVDINGDSTIGELPPADADGTRTNLEALHKLLNGFHAEFAWSACFSRGQFIAAYDADGAPGLDVMRIDSNFDGIADSVLSKGSNPILSTTPTGQKSQDLLTLDYARSPADAALLPRFFNLADGAMQNWIKMAHQQN